MIDKLILYWASNPDLRLAQIIEHAAHMKHGADDHCIYYVEDDAIERGLDELIEAIIAEKGV